jgi:uncharacterized protein YjbI with pentapeptide repeats
MNRKFLVVALVAGAGLTLGCPSSGNLDGGTDVQGTDVQGTDVQGTDVQGTDVQGTDVQGTDVQPDVQGTDVQGTDVQGDVALDAAVDVPGDVRADVPTDTAPACSPDAGAASDPANAIFRGDFIFTARLDTTAGGGSDDTQVATTVINDVMQSPPDDTAGSCIFQAGFLTGSMARNAAPNVDLGTITVTQGSSQFTMTYSATSHMYVVDTTMAAGFLPEMPVMLHTAGGTGFSTPLSAMVNAPFFPIATGMTVTFPAMLSRTAGTTITWTVPPNASDQVAVFWTFSPRFANNVICVVPACVGSLTIPASMSNHYPAGATAVGGLLFERRATLMAGTRPIRWSMGMGVQTRFSVP